MTNDCSDIFKITRQNSKDFFFQNFNRGLIMGTKVLKDKENTRYLGLLLDHN